MLRHRLGHQGAALTLYALEVVLIIISFGLDFTSLDLFSKAIILAGTTVFFSEFMAIKRLLRIRSRIAQLRQMQHINRQKNYLLER
ncbi:hypothetical protein KFE98_07280 [bacterium SCSIO 12741]|nr:hypothetical protein KFE98_07280 [bacterium SCSIO 12741]